MIELEQDLDLIEQALENVATTFGGRSKILLVALRREIKRLRHVQQEEKRREYLRRDRLNAKAKKLGAPLPYPDDDIPF